MFREFDVWRRARNPHIVPLYGFMIEDDGAPALVSPWFNNGSLWKYLKEKPLAGDRKALVCGSQKSSTTTNLVIGIVISSCTGTSIFAQS